MTAKPKPPRKRGAGRPAYEPSGQDRKTVRVMTGYGISQAAIANLILNPDGTPISKPTLRKHFRAELDTGHPEFIAWVADKLRAAIEGSPAVYDAEGNQLRVERPPNVTAMIYALKSQGKDEGWSDKTVIEHGGGEQPIRHEHGVDKDPKNIAAIVDILRSVGALAAEG